MGSCFIHLIRTDSNEFFFFFIVGQKITSNLNQICKDKDYSLGLALISQEPFKLCYNCLTLEMPISRLSYPFPGSNSQLIFSFPFFFFWTFLGIINLLKSVLYLLYFGACWFHCFIAPQGTLRNHRLLYV